VAVEPRLVVSVFPGEDWTLEGRWVGGEETWRPGAAPPTFAGQVFLKALDLLEGRGDERGRRWAQIPPARIEIDSRAFFDADGRKRGFGSSAALAAGITSALARLAGRDELPFHQAAVEAHRFAQGGAGSGYDVTASWFGGFGLFRGGPRPQWEPADPAVLPPLAVFAGPEAVRTVGAIGRYQTWKAENPGAARDFLDRSNAAVGSLVRTRNANALLAAWSEARDLGRELGRRIASDADLAVPKGLPPTTFVKALGAGNELGVAVVEESTPELSPVLFPVRISSEGLRWE
jgi:hypothetical protein